jgi:hypothetical protein
MATPSQSIVRRVKNGDAMGRCGYFKLENQDYDEQNGQTSNQPQGFLRYRFFIPVFQAAPDEC